MFVFDCREKDRREREEEARKEEQKAEKEREIARLRAKQEKARDAQAEEDAVRARRAQEKGALENVLLFPNHVHIPKTHRLFASLAYFDINTVQV